MMLQVNGNALRWSIPKNKGKLFLQFTNGEEVQVYVDSGKELGALGDILRTPSPLFFDSTDQVVATPISRPVPNVVDQCDLRSAQVTHSAERLAQSRRGSLTQ
jgi:hypothetical protein